MVISKTSFSLHVPIDFNGLLNSPLIITTNYLNTNHPIAIFLN